MRHLRLALLTIVFVPSFAFVACGGDDSTPATTPDSSVPDTSVAKDASVADTSKPDTSIVDSSIVDTSVAEGGDAGVSFNFMVVRIGDGANDAGTDAALTNASTDVFLEERRSSDGNVLRTIPMPVAAFDGGGPLTMSGTATSEGALALSGDGHYVVLAGYAVAPGTASVATSSAQTIKRVAGRVDKNGAIDTTTAFADFSGNNVRGATSNDGNQFWVIGATTGVSYVTLGSATTLPIATTQANNRETQIFGGNLLVGTQTGNTYRVYQVGTGLPTTANQTIANLVGTSAEKTNGFAMFDLNSSDRRWCYGRSPEVDEQRFGLGVGRNVQRPTHDEGLRSRRWREAWQRRASRMRDRRRPRSLGALHRRWRHFEHGNGNSDRNGGSIYALPWARRLPAVRMRYSARLQCT
jgi:hypothetical protein